MLLLTGNEKRERAVLQAFHQQQQQQQDWSEGHLEEAEGENGTFTLCTCQTAAFVQSATPPASSCHQSQPAPRPPPPPRLLHKWLWLRLRRRLGDWWWWWCKRWLLLLPWMNRARAAHLHSHLQSLFSAFLFSLGLICFVVDSMCVFVCLVEPLLTFFLFH